MASLNSLTQLFVTNNDQSQDSDDTHYTTETKQSAVCTYNPYVKKDYISPVF